MDIDVGSNETNKQKTGILLESLSLDDFEEIVSLVLKEEQKFLLVFVIQEGLSSLKPLQILISQLVFVQKADS